MNNNETDQCDLRIHNRFFRLYVQENRFETSRDRSELAAALDVSEDQLDACVTRDDFVTEASLDLLRVAALSQFRCHSDYARSFARGYMVSWEREEFATCLGVTIEELDTHMDRSDFLSDSAMDYLRDRSGLGLMVPVVDDYRVDLVRVVDGEIVRKTDGIAVEICDTEYGFDDAMSEVLMLGGPPGFDSGILTPRLYGIM